MRDANFISTPEDVKNNAEYWIEMWRQLMHLRISAVISVNDEESLIVSSRFHVCLCSYFYIHSWQIALEGWVLSSLRWVHVLEC